MKKAFCLLLALVLGLFCFPVSLADTDPDKTAGAIEYAYLGVRFDPPEVYRNTAGIVIVERPFDYSEIIDSFNCTYYAMSEERYAEYRSSRELTIPPDELWIDQLFSVFVMRNGMTFTRFNTISGNMFTSSEMESVREIGKIGDTTYYLFMSGPNPDFIADVDPAYLDEYIAMSSAVDDVVAALSFSEAQATPDPYAGFVGSGVEFTTTDMDGNPVSSSDLFSGNKITLLNVWASWCGPCIGELEDLQGIHQRMHKKGVGVIGMLIDDDLDTARELLNEFNVSYPVILAPDALNDLFYLEGYPTTIFIGSDGTVLADSVIGAYMEKIMTTLNFLLR